MNLWMQSSKQTGGLIMENELDASVFLFKEKVCNHELESILSKVVDCYKMIIVSNIPIPLKDENGIRDILLLDYLKNSYIKKELNLTNYLFDRETYENSSTGRIDIRIMPIKPFISDDAYFVIECKRIDNLARRGTSCLNFKYIENGIKRFATNFYSSFYNTSAMIGFVVEPIDINNNIEDINFLLEKFKDIETFEFIKKEDFIEDFEFHYRSIHQLEDNRELILYHLMFDFSMRI